MYDPNKLVCQACNADFNEKENFNWSCVVHRSTWGGNLWWCCGKTTENARGCLIQRHSVAKRELDHMADDETDEKGKKC
jgi:hypothetical protein